MRYALPFWCIYKYLYAGYTAVPGEPGARPVTAEHWNLATGPNTYLKKLCTQVKV